MPGTDVALIALTADGPDEQRLAAFYATLAGSAIERVGPSGTTLSVLLGSLRLVFRQVAAHRPPTWPDGDVPMQMHVEFEVDDLESAERARPPSNAGGPDTDNAATKEPDCGCPVLDAAVGRLLDLGASLPGWQPHRDDGLLVLLDPAGHPFCVATAR